MSPSTETRENRELAAEIKFKLPFALAERVKGWARTHLHPDPNSTDASGDGYETCSLYFDTHDFAVFRGVGSFKRAKYRIRRYGQSSTVFLERKLKTRGYVTKRRSIVPIEALDRLRSEDPSEGWNGEWFHRRLLLRKLKPICQVTYNRTARVTMTSQGPIRLTMDLRLRAVPIGDLAFDVERSPELILNEECIIELKFCGQVPVLFKQLIQDYGLEPLAVSKYKLAAAKLKLMGDLPLETKIDPQPVYA
ncbi:MAG: hypothetical protein JWN25_3101 [Verrucomicrobiales bacterium]|nr:hypothetical protein [Verrucomicrobiales bacterium]MDB6129553.1 hypothetical protein [Verrucomicrobiales bacterium]